LVGQIKIRCKCNQLVDDITVQINSRFGISFLAYLIGSSEGFLDSTFGNLRIHLSDIMLPPIC
jgi:hypothetical protein